MEHGTSNPSCDIACDLRSYRFYLRYVAGTIVIMFQLTLNPSWSIEQLAVLLAIPKCILVFAPGESAGYHAISTETGWLELSDITQIYNGRAAIDLKSPTTVATMSLFVPSHPIFDPMTR